MDERAAASLRIAAGRLNRAIISATDPIQPLAKIPGFLNQWSNSISMNQIASYIMSVHSYVYSVKGRAKISGDEREASSRLVTSMLVFLPVLAVGSVLITLIALGLGFEQTELLLAVVAIVAFFWVGAFTDRIHDRNESEIKEIAYQICVDPERGENWAIRRLALIIAVQLAFLFAVAAIGRFLYIVGTDMSFVSIWIHCFFRESAFGRLPSVARNLNERLLLYRADAQSGRYRGLGALGVNIFERPLHFA